MFLSKAINTGGEAAHGKLWLSKVACGLAIDLASQVTRKPI